MTTLGELARPPGPRPPPGPPTGRSTASDAGRRARAARRARRGPLLLVAAGVLLLAVAARLAVMVRNGGPTGVTGMYDPGVYYAVADALTFGRLPYRDVLLLHPPTIVWVLTPFAALGRAAGDPTGMAAARLAWVLLGGANAALVVLAARRFGLLAAGVAGAVYALLPPAVRAETAPTLEPLGSVVLLVAVVLLSRPRAAVPPRLQYAAGAAIGLAPTVKIWGVVPLVVVLVLAAGWHGRRAALRVAAGAAAAAAVVCLPLFAAAPGAMWRMVVVDQLGRPLVRTSESERLQSVAGLGWVLGAEQIRAMTALGWVTVGLAVVVLALAALRRDAVPFLLLAVAHVGLLVVSPSFFDHYAAFATPAVALVTGAGVGALLAPSSWWLRLRGRQAPTGLRPPTARSGALRRTAPVAVVCVALGCATVPVIGLTRIQLGAPFPAAQLWPAVAGARCVVADTPEVLVALDVLSRDLRRGCLVRPDLTGLTYDLAAAPLRPGRRAVPRARNERWQRELMGYLTSGDAVLLGRRRSDGFSPANARVVASWPVLGRSGRWRVLDPHPDRAAG